MIKLYWGIAYFKCVLYLCPRTQMSNINIINKAIMTDYQQLTFLTNFFLITGIIEFVVAIAIIVKFWKMANDVRGIKKKLTPTYNKNLKEFYEKIGEDQKAREMTIQYVIDLIESGDYDEWDGKNNRYKRWNSSTAKGWIKDLAKES